MRSNCCTIAVIRPLTRWLKVKFTRIIHIHLRNSNKISGTKFEPFQRTNCGELLDMSSGDVQPTRYHKDVILNVNCKLRKLTKFEHDEFIHIPELTDLACSELVCAALVSLGSVDPVPMVHHIVCFTTALANLSDMHIPQRHDVITGVGRQELAEDLRLTLDTALRHNLINCVILRRFINILGYLMCELDEGDNAGKTNPGCSTESYAAFAHIGLRENPEKSFNQGLSTDYSSEIFGSIQLYFLMKIDIYQKCHGLKQKKRKCISIHKTAKSEHRRYSVNRSRYRFSPEQLFARFESETSRLPPIDAGQVVYVLWRRHTFSAEDSFNRIRNLRVRKLKRREATKYLQDLIPLAYRPHLTKYHPAITNFINAKWSYKPHLPKYYVANTNSQKVYRSVNKEILPLPGDTPNAMLYASKNVRGLGIMRAEWEASIQHYNICRRLEHVNDAHLHHMRNLEEEKKTSLTRLKIAPNSVTPQSKGKHLRVILRKQ
ncbi:hypothetical protein ANN_09413 [Periplaneta americana]|uniref:Uncharacterized protein n=1 Tax=Periplaneta americana TaxID=6978 RepID=A0ABQ8TNB0_PERAM|nr:hypothetical protein ANN_09413 [Periplaneta americana]